MSQLRAIVLAGACGVGKSTLLRLVRCYLSMPTVESAGLLHWEHYRAERLLLMGRYANDADVYPGCDRLPTRAKDWLRLLLRDAAPLGLDGYTLLWEMPFGTDLVTMRAAQAHADLCRVCLTARPERVAERRRLRGWEMPDADWQHRDVRVARFRAHWAPDVWLQETDADLTANVGRLLDLIHH